MSELIGNFLNKDFILKKPTEKKFVNMFYGKMPEKKIIPNGKFGTALDSSRLNFLIVRKGYF